MSKQQRLAVVVFVVGLSMTIGGTASAWSLAGSNWSGFKQGSMWSSSSTTLQTSKPWAATSFKQWWPSFVSSVSSHWQSKAPQKPWILKLKKLNQITKEEPPEQPKPTSPIPEPAAALAFATGLLLIARGARRRR